MPLQYLLCQQWEVLKGCKYGKGPDFFFYYLTRVILVILEDHLEQKKFGIRQYLEAVGFIIKEKEGL